MMLEPLPIGEATKRIAQRVGMSFCPDTSGTDPEVLRLLADVGVTRRRAQVDPDAAADRITEWLDILARDP